MAEVRVIYALADPCTLAVRYIGVTSKPPKERLARHISEAMAAPVDSTSHRIRWLRALIKAGNKPTLSVLRTVSGDDAWQSAERAEIARAKAGGARLVNGTDGGDGTTGRKWRPGAELKKRLADAMRGKKMSPESCARKSQTLRAKYANDPAAMTMRRAMAAQAARSKNGRAAASARMTAIWSDPELSYQMRARMRGARARKRALQCV
jgi:hypothetical protein